MTQPDCGCNDYSLLTANTGINVIDTANPNLDGSGTIVQVFTAGINGSIVKSIIVKAIQPTTSGMIRLFRQNGSDIVLFKELIMPIAPRMASTPTPLPPMQMALYNLECNLYFESGEILYASTENSETFNVIVEGLDISYPSSTPTVCCNFEQELPNTGNMKIYEANTNLDGSPPIVAIFTADSSASGAIIKSISINALQSTSPGVVRLFVSPDGTHYYLMNEIYIPQHEQSAFLPAFNITISQNYHLQAGYIIGASTENAESFGVSIQGVKWSYPS